MPSVELIELTTHAQCPERERRRKADPHNGIAPIERRYRTNLRKMLVRFYSGLLDEQPVTEAQLRRSWSTLWSDIPVQPMGTRTFQKGNASYLNGLLTDTERVCLRGAEAMHRLFTRPLNKSISPIIVDEPFAIELGRVTITGRFDLVFEDRSHRYWIVDWTDYDYRYEFQYDLRHAVLLAAFKKLTGRSAAGVLVDYLCTIGDAIEVSKRTPEALQDQIEDATQIATALAQQIIYKNYSACAKCAYKPSCRGIKIVQQKRARGRPRKRPHDAGPQ